MCTACEETLWTVFVGVVVLNVVCLLGKDFSNLVSCRLPVGVSAGVVDIHVWAACESMEEFCLLMMGKMVNLMYLHGMILTPFLVEC